MRRRGIKEQDVKEIIENPGQTEEIHPGRLILQSPISSGDPIREFLVRVFIDVFEDRFEVVTVYRTSKIEKYWR
jgi:hypothetical protein